MAVAQRLYEAGFITYMRTDSVNLSNLAISTAATEINTSFGEQYHKLRKYSTKSKGAQEAHEAIRPTYISNKNEEGSNQEQRLYELIWKRTVASQMIDATYKQVGIEFLLGSKFLYKYSGSFLKDNGFKEIYDLSENDEKEKLIKN